MKKFLIVFAVGLLPAMLPALPFTLTPSSQWKTTSGDAASIDYDGSRIWPKLRLSPSEKLKPNTIYRLSFEAKSSSDRKRIQFCYQTTVNGKSCVARPDFMPNTKFMKYTLYLTSGETGKMEKMHFLFNPTSPFKLELKNIRLDEMTDSLLYGKNLLPCGDFEEDNTFQPYAKKQAPFVKVVDSPNFLCGEKSLQLTTSKGESAEMISAPIPALPGKTVEVKFYAKSTLPVKGYIIIDFGAFGGKHCYLPYTFKIESNWKEFTHEFKIPEDVKLYPALLWKLAHFRLGIRSLDKNDANAYIDGITYIMK